LFQILLDRRPAEHAPADVHGSEGIESHLAHCFSLLQNVL
jgi:hypothetical protein